MKVKQIRQTRLREPPDLRDSPRIIRGLAGRSKILVLPKLWLIVKDSVILSVLGMERRLSERPFPTVTPYNFSQIGPINLIHETVSNVENALRALKQLARMYHQPTICKSAAYSIKTGSDGVSLE